MNCQSYIELTVTEKVELIGKICHLIQSDENSFRDLSSYVRQCENNGLLKDVVILPQPIKEETS